MLEAALAATNTPGIREATRASMASLVPSRCSATRPRGRSRLAAVVRTFAHLITGVSMPSATCAELPRDNLSQFTEPFRRAVLAQCGPPWGDVCKLLVQAENT